MRSFFRNVFLDNSHEFADVLRQFTAAIHYDRIHFSAIAIIHPCPNTISVVQACLRNLREDIQSDRIDNLYQHQKVNPPNPFVEIFSELPTPTSVEPFDPVGLLLLIP